MSPAQQRFGSGGVKSCSSRFSATPDGPAGRTQFLVDPRRAVEAMVLLEHRLDFSGDQGVLRLPLSRRRLLPALPGVVTAAGHSQSAAVPGDGVLISQLIDQAKPLGGSCSLTKGAAASLKKSFSLLSSRFSRRSCTSSARSSLVNGPWPQGRLKVCPGRPWRACHHWVSSAGLTAPDARNRLRCSRSGRAG